jgi:hypothetical protein
MLSPASLIPNGLNTKGPRQTDCPAEAHISFCGRRYLLNGFLAGTSGTGEGTTSTSSIVLSV